MNQLSPDLSHFQCLRCGACCRRKGVVRVSDAEIDAIAAYLGIPPADFIRDYTQLLPDRSGLTLTEQPDGSCNLYDADRNACRIQAAKPFQCRAFPFSWRFPGWDDVCEGGKALKKEKL